MTANRQWTAGRPDSDEHGVRLDAEVDGRRLRGDEHLDRPDRAAQGGPVGVGEQEDRLVHVAHAARGPRRRSASAPRVQYDS